MANLIAFVLAEGVVLWAIFHWGVRCGLKRAEHADEVRRAVYNKPPLSNRDQLRQMFLRLPVSVMEDGSVMSVRNKGHTEMCLFVFNEAGRLIDAGHR